MDLPELAHSFNLSNALYDKYDALALGWVTTIALAGYVVFLHSRINSIWKSHVEFAQKALTDMQPYFERNTSTMASCVTLLQETSVQVESLQDRQLLIIGRLGMKDLVEDAPDGGS